MHFVPLSNKHEKKCNERSNAVRVKFDVLGFYYNRHYRPKIKLCGIHFVYGSECGDSRVVSDFMMAEEQSVGQRNTCPKEGNWYSKYLMFGLDPNEQEESPDERDEEEAEISDSSEMELNEEEEEKSVDEEWGEGAWAFLLH